MLIMNILTEKDVARFWGHVAKTESPNDCWIWTAYRDQLGYGNIGIGGKVEKAHRVAWVISNGAIPDGLLVLHNCDNPSCVRFEHLRLGTDLDNSRDRENRHRGNKAHGDRNGSRLHPEKLVRGEDHHEAKLTWGKVREIRRRYKWGGIGGDSLTTLATEFGMNPATIQRIVKKKLWIE
jgi:hypothetical protein